METIQYIPCTDTFSANGTSLKGYIHNVNTNQLIEMFGNPLPGSADGKTTMEWVIETQTTNEDGDTEYSVFTLYDWKGSSPDNNYSEWTINVGGKTSQDLWNAEQAFEIFNTTDVKYSADYACMAQGIQHEVEVI